MNHSDDPRKLIIDTFRLHPEGLTFSDLARKTGLHRHTITKYIYELTGAGVIHQRRVGVAKLCYLKERFLKEVNDSDIIKELKKGYGEGF